MQRRTEEILRGFYSGDEVPIDHTAQDNESIMLKADERQYYYDRYQKLVDRYQKDVDAKGGDDTMIKILEDRLVNSILEAEDKINQIILELKTSHEKKGEKKEGKKEEKKSTLTDKEKREKVVALIKKVRSGSIGPDDNTRIAVTDDELQVSQAIKMKRDHLSAKKKELKAKFNKTSQDSAERKDIESKLADVEKELLAMPTLPFALRKEQFEAMVTYCALCDINNEYLGRGYPNLFSKGAKMDDAPVEYVDARPGVPPARQRIPARSMLAITIASALDPKMEIWLTKEDEKKYGSDSAGMEKYILDKYGSREKLTERCIQDVIAALNNARRSHNADTDERKISRKADFHTCIWGGEGVMLKKGNMHNRLIAKPPVATYYHLIPDAVETFVLEELKKADDATRKAFYNFAFNKYSMNEEVSPADVLKCNAFLDSLKNNPKKLHDYLLGAIEGLPRETQVLPRVPGGHHLFPRAIAELPARIKNGADQLLDVCIRAFKEEKDYAPSLKAKTGILIATHEVIFKDLRERLISERVHRHKEQLTRISEDLARLKRVIDSDKRRGLLAPHYMKSFQEDYLQLMRAELEDECEARFKVLPEDLAAQLLKEFKEGALEIATGLEAPTMPQIQEITKPLEGAFTELYTKINYQIDDITVSLNELDKLYQLRKEGEQKGVKQPPAELKTRGSEISLSEIKASLPALPTMKVIPKDSTPVSWALNFIFLAFEKDPLTQKPVRDVREIGRLIDFMREHFDSLPSTERAAKIDEVLKFIQLYLKEYQIPREGKQEPVPQGKEESERAAARLLLERVFADKGINITHEELKPKKGIIPYAPFMLTRFNKGAVDESLVKTAKKDPRDAEWINAARKIIGSDTAANKLEDVANFVLLSVFSKLQLTELRERDANTLRRLCALYLGVEPLGINDKLAYEPPGGAPLDVRIAHLAAHIDDLIKTLIPVKGLFNQGVISIISNDEAGDIVFKELEKGVEEPCCVRVSFRTPGTPLVMTWVQHDEGLTEYTATTDYLVTDLMQGDTSVEKKDGVVLLKPDFFKHLEPHLKTLINIHEASGASELKSKGVTLTLADQLRYQQQMEKQAAEIEGAIETAKDLEKSGDKVRRARYRFKSKEDEAKEKKGRDAQELDEYALAQQIVESHPEYEGARHATEFESAMPTRVSEAEEADMIEEALKAEEKDKGKVSVAEQITKHREFMADPEVKGKEKEKATERKSPSPRPSGNEDPD